MSFRSKYQGEIAPGSETIEVIPPQDILVSSPFSGHEDRPRTPTPFLLSISGDVPEAVGCFTPSIHCFLHSGLFLRIVCPLLLLTHPITNKHIHVNAQSAMECPSISGRLKIQAPKIFSTSFWLLVHKSTRCKPFITNSVRSSESLHFDWLNSYNWVNSEYVSINSKSDLIHMMIYILIYIKCYKSI